MPIRSTRRERPSPLAPLGRAEDPGDGDHRRPRVRPRGLYGGGVGYYSWTGDADFAIVIRTATVEDEGDRDRITVQAGAGLVADSDPTAEYEETEQKMGGVLAALEAIELPTDDDDSSPDDELDATAEVSR